MAFAVKYELEGASSEFYDAVNKRLGVPGQTTDGMITHIAFPTETGWCVCEIWNSASDRDRFWDDRLEQALAQTAQEMGVDIDRFDMQSGDVHLAFSSEFSLIHA